MIFIIIKLEPIRNYITRHQINGNRNFPQPYLYCGSREQQRWGRRNSFFNNFPNINIPIIVEIVNQTFLSCKSILLLFFILTGKTSFLLSNLSKSSIFQYIKNGDRTHKNRYEEIFGRRGMIRLACELVFVGQNEYTTQV